MHRIHIRILGYGKEKVMIRLYTIKKETCCCRMQESRPIMCGYCYRDK